jgi:hypothetical protein
MVLQAHTCLGAPDRAVYEADLMNADRFRRMALALYGSHAAGTDLNHDERAMLAELAD